jgi:hypothetical protein
MAAAGSMWPEAIELWHIHDEDSDKWSDIFAVSSAPAGEFAVHYGYTSLYILRSNGNRGPSLKKILTDEVIFWLFLRLLQRILPFIMATPLYDQKQRRQ